jgi:hypothetical protein
MTINALVLILLIVLVAWAVTFIFGKLPSPPPPWFAQIVWVVASVAVVVLLIKFVLDVTGVSLP